MAIGRADDRHAADAAVRHDGVARRAARARNCGRRCIDPRALVRIAAESGSGGERAAIAAPLGVLLRERVG